MTFGEIHLSKTFDRWIIGFYSVKAVLELINVAILVTDATNWLSKSKKALSLGNLNSYKECTLHFVKYSLSAFILSCEVIIFWITLISSLEYFQFEKSANEYFTSILPSTNCSMYNSQAMVCAAYLEGLCLSVEALTVILISTILDTTVVLTDFLITVLVRSEIDTETIKRSFHRMFWKNLILFTLQSLQMTYVLGVVLAYSVVIYQALFSFRWAFRKLLYALIVKSNDPQHNSVDRKYFRKQAEVFRWGSTVVYVFSVPILVSVSLFWIVKKGVLELFFRPCWVEYLYGIHIPRGIISTLHPAMSLIVSIIAIAERVSLFSWILVSIVLNLGVQVRYLKAYIKQHRLLGKQKYRFRVASKE